MDKADHGGQFMLDVWQHDPNARVAKDGSIRASISRDQLTTFRDFLTERGWELVGQQGAPGGKRMFCKAVPLDA